MSGPRPAPRRTRTNEARRAQIVESAIQVIADAGYSGASFAHIAAHAGISSTRLISYHFTEKDDLIQEALRTVVDRFTDFVRPRAEAETSPRARLMAALAANVDFMRAHRAEALALDEIQLHHRGPDGRLVRTGRRESDLATLEGWLRAGQRARELGDFDPGVMALFVLSLRNGVIQRYHERPDLDLVLVKEELLAAIDHATRRRDPASSG